jgi:hypothetical protein
VTTISALAPLRGEGVGKRCGEEAQVWLERPGSVGSIESTTVLWFFLPVNGEAGHRRLCSQALKNTFLEADCYI